MKKKILIPIATVLISLTGLNAQKIYELDEVKQLPTIDNSNMDIIAASIQQLFIEALKDPINYSTISATEETICAFYDSDEDIKLQKVNPIRGKQYTSSDSTRLRLNQISSYRNDIVETSLFFNLTFDDSGKLLVPEKINVISYRREGVKKNGSTYNENVGLLAFELIVNESIKNLLSKIQLKTNAGIDVNSLTGEVKPVAIKCPFNFKYGVSKLSETKGHAIKRGDHIDIKLTRHFKNIEEKNSIINLLKQQTDILTYKKGEFDFLIIKESSYRNVGFNIVADNIFINRVSKTSNGGSSTQIERVISFSGEGNY